MFKWLDKFLSRPYEKAADEVERMVKETQVPPFRNPIKASTAKPRIGVDAQHLVLWLEQNDFYYDLVEGWIETVIVSSPIGAYKVEIMSDRAKEYYNRDAYSKHFTVLQYTKEETEWIMYNARKIKQAHEDRENQEAKNMFRSMV